MGSLGDAVVSHPVSGSYSPSVYMQVKKCATSASLTILTASQTSQLALPANPNRLGFMIRNTSPVSMFLRYGQGPCDSYSYSFTLGAQGGIGWANDAVTFLGEIHCVWDTSAAASGTLKITELT